MAETYATYYARALSGVSDLAEITDATSATSTIGTDCDRDYWEGHAYDQIRQLYLELGPSPGGGSSGSWTINNDATGDETSYLYFYRGTSLTAAYIGWDATNSVLRANHSILPEASTINLGSASVPWQTGYFTDLDVSGDVTIDTSLTTVDCTITGTLTVDTFAFNGTVLTLNADATTGEDVSIAVTRGTGTTDNPAYIRWDEADGHWKIAEPGGSFNAIVYEGSSDSITTDMFASTVYGGSGGEFGTADTVARSDHTHSGGTLSASGTTSQTFTLDSDWASGVIGLYFSGSTYAMSLDPGASTPAFTFTHNITPLTNKGANIGLSTMKWNNLHIGGTAYFDGDIELSGTFTSNVYTTENLWGVNNSTGGGLDIQTGASSHAYMMYLPTDGYWKLQNDSDTTYHQITTTDETQTLTNKTLTSPIITAIDSGTTLSTTGYKIHLDTAASPQNKGYIQVTDALGHEAYMGFDGSSWIISTNGLTNTNSIATIGGTETLTNKTLTSPTISSGTFTGTSSFGANVTFTKTTSNTIKFDTGDTGQAPFTVSKASTVTDNLPVITNLNADLVDGIEGSDILSIDSTSGEYELQADLNVGSYTIKGIDLTPDAHESSHMSGGADELSGTLGSGVTGTASDTWRVGTTGSSTANIFYLGNTNSYFMQINDTTNKLIGIGGTSVHLVGGDSKATTITQDLGISSQPWRSAWIQQHVNLKPLGSATPSSASGYTDGSIWRTDASAGNGNIAKLRTSFLGGDVTIIDDQHKTDMVGSNGDWSINGDLTVNGITAGGISCTSVTSSGTVKGTGLEATSYVSSTGYIHAGTNITAGGNATITGDISAAGTIESTGGDIGVHDGNKVYLSTDKNSYFKFVLGGSVPNKVQLYVDGALKQEW